MSGELSFAERLELALTEEQAKRVERYKTLQQYQRDYRSAQRATRQKIKDERGES